jgi:hypothetical protein
MTMPTLNMMTILQRARDLAGLRQTPTAPPRMMSTLEEIDREVIGDLVAKIDDTAEIRSELEDQIRLLAYFKWEDAGRPEGDGAEFWNAAETEILEWAHNGRCCGGKCHG